MATGTVYELEGKAARQARGGARLEARRELREAIDREVGAGGTGVFPARRSAGGDVSGEPVDGDGAAGVPGMRAQRPPARPAAGHRGFDDAVGAAAGEPGGFAVELRAGGRAAARVVGLNFGAKRIERATRAVGGDGSRRWGLAGARGLEAGAEAVLRGGRHRSAGAAG